MPTIKLKIENNVYDKFLNLLNNFSKDEIKIINDFDATKIELQNEINEMNLGNAKYIDIDELDKRLDKIIDKYENNI